MNHCKHCQRPHHTLLHVDSKDDLPPEPSSGADMTTLSLLHSSISSSVLLMTCQVMVETPQGVIKVQALLDTGSSASFVSECLAQSLRLHRLTQDATIYGIAGLKHSDGKESTTQFLVSSVHSSGAKYNVKAHRSWGTYQYVQSLLSRVESIWRASLSQILSTTNLE